MTKHPLPISTTKRLLTFAEFAKTDTESGDAEMIDPDVAQIEIHPETNRSKRQRGQLDGVPTAMRFGS